MTITTPPIQLLQNKFIVQCSAMTQIDEIEKRPYLVWWFTILLSLTCGSLLMAEREMSGAHYVRNQVFMTGLCLYIAFVLGTFRIELHTFGHVLFLLWFVDKHLEFFESKYRVSEILFRIVGLFLYVLAKSNTRR
jgi:hypothetical protein